MTAETLDASFDRLSKSTLRLKLERDTLLIALREMTDIYWGVADDHNGDGGPPPACIVRARAAIALADEPHPIAAALARVRATPDQDEGAD